LVGQGESDGLVERQLGTFGSQQSTVRLTQNLVQRVEDPGVLRHVTRVPTRVEDLEGLVCGTEEPCSQLRTTEPQLRSGLLGDHPHREHPTTE
jgi:hypothetical protein